MERHYTNYGKIEGRDIINRFGIDVSFYNRSNFAVATLIWRKSVDIIGIEGFPKDSYVIHTEITYQLDLDAHLVKGKVPSHLEEFVNFYAPDGKQLDAKKVPELSNILVRDFRITNLSSLISSLKQSLKTETKGFFACDYRKGNREFFLELFENNKPSYMIKLDNKICYEDNECNEVQVALRTDIFTDKGLINELFSLIEKTGSKKIIKTDTLKNI